jgi:hypothetical protein
MHSLIEIASPLEQLGMAAKSSKKDKMRTLTAEVNEITGAGPAGSSVKSLQLPLSLIKEYEAGDRGGILGDALATLVSATASRRGLNRTARPPRYVWRRLYCCASQSLCFWLELA